MTHNHKPRVASVPPDLVADMLRVEAEVSQAEGALAALEADLKKVDAVISRLRAKALEAGIPISIPPMRLAPAGAAAPNVAVPSEQAAMPAPPVSEKPLARFMKVKAYAEYRGASKRTIETKIIQGMPIVGRGHDRRVDREAADAWFRDRGEGNDIKVLARRNAALKAAKEGRLP